MVIDRVGWEGYLRNFAGRIKEDRSFYAASGLFLGLSALYLLFVGEWQSEAVAQTIAVYGQVWLLTYGVIFPLLMLGIAYCRITLRLNDRRSLAYRYLFGPRRVGRFVAGTAMMAGFFPFRVMFNSLKNAIPDRQSFRFDKLFADIDQAIFFGHAPWQLLHSFLRNELALRIIEINYNSLWFVICFGAQYWVATSPRFDAIRLRYVLCFMLTWIIAGNVLATMFSSAGPVYYGLVTGDLGRFDGLTSLLTTSAGQFGAAVDYQSYLWTLYANHLAGLGSGISAFPSVHVAVITMNALFLCEANRRWVWPSIIYVGFTWLCSVYLGWHYAIDGFASILLVFAIFRLVNWACAVRWSWPLGTPKNFDSGAVADGG